MTREIRFFESLGAANRELAANLAAILQTEAATKGHATLVLTGGSTPQGLYQELAAAPLPWRQIHLFWGDERFVPQDHPDSNYRMAKTTLLDRLELPPANIHPMVTGLDVTPTAAAARYEQALREFFGLRATDSPLFPVFDCVLLGMGTDGHAASLFPGSPQLAERQRWTVATAPAGTPSIPRITLTLPVLNHARRVIFLISGPRKRQILDEIVGATATAMLHYPAARIDTPTQILWYVAHS